MADNKQVNIDVNLRMNQAEAARGLKALQNTQKGLDGVAAGVKDVNKAASDTTFQQRMEADAKAARQASDALKDVKFGREQIGDQSTFLSSAGSLAGSLGAGSGVTGALTLGADTTGALEYVGKFKQSLIDAGEAASQNAGLLGNLSSAASSAIPGLAGAGAGLVAIAAVAAPIVAIVAAIGIAVNQIIEKNKELDAQIAADVTKQAEVQRQIAEGLTTEEAEKRVADLQKLLQTEQQILSDNEATYARAQEAARKQAGVLGDVIFSIAQQSSQAEQATSDNIESAKKNVTDYTAEIDALNSALGKGATVGNDVATLQTELTAKETELSTARKQHDAVIGQLKQQEIDLTAALETRRKQQQADLELQQKRIAADIKLSASRAERDRDITEARAQILLDEQLEKEAAAHAANMLQIQARGNEAIAQAQAAVTERTIQANTQIAELQTQRDAAREKAEEQYRRDSAQRWQAYHDRLRQINQTFEDAEFDAKLNNDVSAQLRAKREKARAEQEATRDFNREDRRARRSFEREQKEQDEALAARIVQIQGELLAFTQAQAAKIEQIRTGTADEIAAAQKAYTEKLELDTKARERQNEWEETDRKQKMLDDFEDRRIKNERDAEDRSIREGREDDSLAAQLQRIDDKKQAEIAAINDVINKVNELRTNISLLQSPPLVPGGPVQTIPVTPFAAGGIITRPFTGHVTMGEREKEGVFPLSRLSEFVPGLGGGGSPAVINTEGMFNGATFNVGEIVKPSDMMAFKAATQDAMKQAFDEFARQTQ